MARPDAILLQARGNSICQIIQLLPIDPPLWISNRRIIGAFLGKDFDKGGQRRKV